MFAWFSDLGVRFEWHEFELDEPLDWSRSFHADSLELCLNLSGGASVRCGSQLGEFRPLTEGFYLPGKRNGLQAVRHPGQPHRFLTVELSHAFLAKQLGRCGAGLHPLVHSGLGSDRNAPGVGPVKPLTPLQVDLVQGLRTPPVAESAQRLWFGGKPWN